MLCARALHHLPPPTTTLFHHHPAHTHHHPLTFLSLTACLLPRYGLFSCALQSLSLYARGAHATVSPPPPRGRGARASQAQPPTAGNPEQDAGVARQAVDLARDGRAATCVGLCVCARPRLAREPIQPGVSGEFAHAAAGEVRLGLSLRDRGLQRGLAHVGL